MELHRGVLEEQTQTLNKVSNTGRLVKKYLCAAVEVIIWRRTEPDMHLVELINQGTVAMLYPDRPSQGTVSVELLDGGSKQNTNVVLNDGICDTNVLDLENRVNDFESFVILDSTWQEARKMYNRSTYLQQAKKISLQVDTPSTYRKRRNQIEGGLSTAECVIELLKQKNEQSLSFTLQEQYDLFNIS